MTTTSRTRCKKPVRRLEIISPSQLRRWRKYEFGLLCRADCFHLSQCIDFKQIGKT